MTYLLKITDLTIAVNKRILFNDFNLVLNSGEKAAFVGESGCGKSTLAKSLINLTDSKIKILSGEILFQGEDILKRSKTQLTKIRGCEIGYIFQSAASVLNPTDKIMTQIFETYKSHFIEFDERELELKTIKILRKLGMGEDEVLRVLNSYPRQLSGGQAARSYLALICLMNPKLIIADETFAELDDINKENLLNYLSELSKSGTSVIVISHNKEVVKSFTNNIYYFKNRS